ncbi:MAG: hypothetical protein AB1792_01540 [Candidatus Zixiibacteriota bacterium]
MVNVVVRGEALPPDPDCPRARTDVDCDGVTAMSDVVSVIDVVFSGANSAVEFCNPCAP